MKKQFLPWFLLFCAIGLSSTAAYYSVVGLSIVFVGVAIPVIIMGTFLEISKIAIATYLHDKWKETYTALKIYLTVALVILSVITSLGIYGLLSTGFQENIAKLEIGTKQIQNIEVKKKRFEAIKAELTKEKSILDTDITKLRDGLSTNTTTQSVDKKTGQLITRENSGNRKSFESQIKLAQLNRDTLSKRIDALNDSITALDVKILDMESKETSSSELGAIKYVSELTGSDVKSVANWFIFILIFVFDPLAITLVIATNQAFNGLKLKKNIYGEPKPEAKIWETANKLREEGKLETVTEPEEEPSALANSQYRNEYSIEEEKQRLLEEIHKIKNSGATGRKIGTALQDAQNKLRDLDNQITY